MTDRYTKSVLTIIAIALCALVAQNSIPRASAQSGCGQWMYNPCYVSIAGNNDYSPLSVRVTNEVEVTGTVRMR